MRKISIIVGLGLLLAAGSARAQQSQYLLPVERGIVESHLDLQYQYSKLEVLNSDINISILSIEGQYVFFDRLELGVNVPFLTHANATFGGTSASESEFGNLMLSAKVKLFGVGDVFGIAAYLNGYLPTHSSSPPEGMERENNVVLQGGAAAEAGLLGVQLGGGVVVVSNLREGDNPTLLGFNGYGRVPIFPFIGLQLAVEYFNSLHPSSDLNAFLVTPGVEVKVWVVHASVGARIAATDEAKAIIGGRVGVLANAGLRF